MLNSLKARDESGAELRREEGLSSCEYCEMNEVENVAHLYVMNTRCFREAHDPDSDGIRGSLHFNLF